MNVKQFMEGAFGGYTPDISERLSDLGKLAGIPGEILGDYYEYKYLSDSSLDLEYEGTFSFRVDTENEVLYGDYPNAVKRKLVAPECCATCVMFEVISPSRWECSIERDFDEMQPQQTFDGENPAMVICEHYDRGFFAN